MTGMHNLKLSSAVVPGLLGVKEHEAIRLVGLRRRIQGLPAQVIPEFWNKFSPYRGWIPGQVDKTTYGVLLDAADGGEGFDYLTAVEVDSFDKTSSDWDQLEVPGHRYAEFPHRDHVSELRQTLHLIFARSLPALNLSPLRRVPGMPLLVERYDGSFDLRTGWGDIQIWVPLDR